MPTSARAFIPWQAPGSCHPAQVRASLVYTLQDAEYFVNCAEIYLDQNGLRALHELQNDARWNSGPTYLFLIDLETHIQIMSGALPALNGTDLSDLEDSTGYRFVEAGLRDAELYGEGVSYYEFPNPNNRPGGSQDDIWSSCRNWGFQLRSGHWLVPSLPCCLPRHT